MKHYIIGKCVQGASHIRSNTECQDRRRTVTCDDGTIILSVADGHGSNSSPYSGTGARIAVHAFCQIMKTWHDRYAENPERFITFLNREGDTLISKTIDAEWKSHVLEKHKKNGREFPVLSDGEIDKSSVYKLYGTTLLGLLIAKEFVFAFQLGDGDICYANRHGCKAIIEPDKLLGVETHSLSKENAWEKARTIVRRIEIEDDLPAIFTLSTDGFANSYKSEEAFHDTIADYLRMINEHGVKTVEHNLSDWLSETSAMGCGDDITLHIAYFTNEDSEEVDKLSGYVITEKTEDREVIAESKDSESEEIAVE